MKKQSGSMHYAMWQATTHSIKSDDEVHRAAEQFMMDNPIYSAHDCNCHKLAIVLANFACGGLDKETNGSLDQGCLHTAANYHKSNASWIAPYSMLPDDHEHVFLKCTIKMK
eukprot:TRINITY_DN84854_c0_g1_i1.p2 TRINITY_DN84854_c0_g1~~TRINITY_DN84854_c0_g1_i1.p2  ORF type:complete len:125 (+),score=26.16 TRINITY_DN84854_c0_g1_i1:40-375(+)